MNLVFVIIVKLHSCTYKVSQRYSYYLICFENSY